LTRRRNFPRQSLPQTAESHRALPLHRKALCSSHLCLVEAKPRTIHGPSTCVFKNKIAHQANYLQGIAARSYSANKRRYLHFEDTMLFHFDPLYFMMIAPALLLAVWAQFRIRSAYARAQQQPAPLSGAAAARHILDQAGLQNISIEMVPGEMTDHYDPRDKVLRLSTDVYQSRSLAAVGIAAHESGHALQDAKNYAPLAIRNAVVPAAGIGTNVSFLLFFLGIIFSLPALIWAGIILFSGFVFFQVVNLPVEFDASARGKHELVALGIVPQQDMPFVNSVLNAAALTYVAATLQAVLTLLYYILRASDSRR
jgi:uncharacterized protein